MWVLPLLQLHNWAHQEKRDFSRTYRTSVVNKTRSQQLCRYLRSSNTFYLPNFAIFLLSHGNKSRRYREVVILPQTLLTSLWLDGEGLTQKSKIRQGSQPSTKSDTNSADYGNMEGDVHPFSVWDPAASSTCRECRYLGSFSQINFVSMGEGKERFLKLNTFKVCGDFLLQTKVEPQELSLSSNQENDRTGQKNLKTLKDR